MTRYEFLLTVHIIAAIAWLGSAVCVQLLGARAAASNDPARKQRVADDAEWLATRLFIPASLTVFAFGVLLVLDSDFWGFTQTWVWLGLAGYAISFLMGILYFGPESARIRKAYAAGDRTDAEARVQRILLFSRIELGILLLVVVDMVAKPGL